MVGTKIAGYTLIVLGIIYMILAFIMISIGMTGLVPVILGLAAGISFTFALAVLRW
jgi:hypothetical protein